MESHECQLRRDSISHLPKLFPDSSWNLRLARKLRKLILVSKYHPEVFFYLKSNAAVEKESQRQVQLYPGFIIHPLSEFRKYWNILISVVIFFHQIITAFAIGFIVDVEDETVSSLVLIDLLFCLIMFTEILLTFRTGYIVKETNEIILDSKIIAKKYMKNFFLDIFGCLPFTYITTKIVDVEGDTINGALVVFMLCLFAFSFCRLLRISFYFSSIPIILNLSEKGSIILTLCLRSIYW